MTTESTTKCDNCKHELNDSGPRTDYRLVLGCEQIPSTSNVSFGVLVHPPLKGLHHFCGFGCLEVWLQRRPK